MLHPASGGATRVVAPMPSEPPATTSDPAVTHPRRGSFMPAWHPRRSLSPSPGLWDRPRTRVPPGPRSSLSGSPAAPGTPTLPAPLPGQGRWGGGGACLDRPESWGQ